MSLSLTYAGPMTAVVLATGEELLLHPGSTHVLAADDPFVIDNLALGRFTVVAEAAPSPLPDAPATATTPAPRARSARRSRQES